MLPRLCTGAGAGADAAAALAAGAVVAADDDLLRLSAGRVADMEEGAESREGGAGAGVAGLPFLRKNTS